MTHESAERQARQLEKKLVFDVHAGMAKSERINELMQKYMGQENSLFRAQYYDFDLAIELTKPGAVIRIRPGPIIDEFYGPERQVDKDRLLLLCPV